MQEDTFQRQVIIIGLLIAIAAGLLAHVFFPRYDWKTIQGEHSLSIVVYDRWSGRFQRAVYQDDGRLNTMGPYTPF